MSLIVVIASSIAISQLWAQPKRFVTNEQKKVLDNADIAYEGFKYAIAADYYEKYLKSVRDTSNALLTKLADCYWQTREYNDAFRIYQSLYRDVNPKATIQQKLRIGELYARFHNYKQASQWLSGIYGYQTKVASFMDTLKLKSMKKDSLNWHLGFLNINTPYQEFSPAIVGDTLYFSSNRPNRIGVKISKAESANYDRLWKISKSEKNTNPLKKLNLKSKGKLNVPGTVVGKGASLFKGLEKFQYNIGTVSIDKNNHYYFTANYLSSGRIGINRLRLIEGFFNRNGTLKMKVLPFGDPKLFSVMHPAINRDGTFLVISSDKPNGKGNNDLYYTRRKSILKPWDNLKAFGKNINTAGNEVFPTLTSDGYLYFSSDALAGLGGLDIYRISLQDALNGKENVEHLSYPINSSGDDFGWSQDSTTTSGFFTSDRLDNDDIYSFLYKHYQKMCNISGSVLDLFTKEPIMNATVFILNKETKKVNIAKTDKKGKYNFILASTDTVILKAVKIGLTNDFLTDRSNGKTQQEDTVLKNMQNLLLEIRIANINDTVSSNNENHSSERSGNVMQNLLLNKHVLLINANWKLNNIYYDFNSWDIRADAVPVLDSLISLLKMYPIRVELGSHTDSRGTFEYNDRLSQKRAESVVDYLVKHGINKDRVTAIGYGKRFLLNKCADGVPCSESENQVNRRTEVKVISNTDIQKYQIDAIDPDKFKDGEQIDQSALPADFFDNCDKLN